MIACLASVHGRRRAGANTIAPSVTRSVRAAIAASSVHGSGTSTAPIEIASQPNTPSQPARLGEHRELEGLARVARGEDDPVPDGHRPIVPGPGVSWSG